MLDYDTFKQIFDDKIFAKSKADLIEKVAKYPDRYVGIFRSTTPKDKLIQNLAQSHEIRFGDAFEDVIRQSFILEGWRELPNRLVASDGKKLHIDQLLTKDGEVLFVEQKIRDDHDSTKKDGQINNFRHKLETLIQLYGAANIKGFFYFIDPSLVKNRSFYSGKLEEMADTYQSRLFVSYGQDMFDRLGYPHLWDNIKNHLQRWHSEVPDSLSVNFDSSPGESFEEIKNLSLGTFRKIFLDNRLTEQILPVLFPTGATLELVLRYLESNPRAADIVDYLTEYLAVRRIALMS